MAQTALDLRLTAQRSPAPLVSSDNEAPPFLMRNQAVFRALCDSADYLESDIRKSPLWDSPALCKYKDRVRDYRLDLVRIACILGKIG